MKACTGDLYHKQNPKGDPVMLRKWFLVPFAFLLFIFNSNICHCQEKDDWGDLKHLVSAMGPRTPFQTFMKRLKAGNPKGCSSNVSSISRLSAYPIAHILYYVPGPGKVYADLEVFPLGDELIVKILYGFDMPISKSRSNRDARILQAARALEYTDVEIKRIKGVLKNLPLAHKTNCQSKIIEFLSLLPPKVVNAFSKAVDAESEPAVGFPLSDKHIMEILFCRSTSGGFYDNKSEWGKMSHWWTVIFHDVNDESYTGGKPYQLWPRLSLKEVDALCK